MPRRAFFRRRLRIDDGCVDCSRADGIEADSAVLELSCRSAHAGAHGSLGYVIACVFGDTLEGSDGRDQNDGVAVADQGKRFLDGEEEPAHVSTERFFEVLFSRVNRRLRIIYETRVSDQDIDAALPFPDSCIESIEITYALNVAEDRRHTLSDQGGRLVMTAKNVNECPLSHEPLSRRQSDAAAAALDDGDFVLQPAHRFSHCVRHAKNLVGILAMGNEVGGLGFIPLANEPLAKLNLGSSSSREG